MADEALLDRNPAWQDELDSHQPLADAIASLIRRVGGGKAVAILGGWGSGKSTVVKLLKNNLENGEQPDGKESKVLIFDAWAHQGDPLRLSFLDWLLDELTREKWINRKNLEKDFRKAVGLSSVVTTTTSKSVSIWGGLI